MAWWFGVAAMVDSLSFSHFDSLSQIRCGFWFALNFCCGSLRSVWIGDQNRQQGLKIGGDSVVESVFVLILLLGFQFLMETVSHRKLEFFLLGCLICKVSNRGK